MDDTSRAVRRLFAAMGDTGEHPPADGLRFDDLGGGEAESPHREVRGGPQPAVSAPLPSPVPRALRKQRRYLDSLRRVLDSVWS